MFDWIRKFLGRWSKAKATAPSAEPQWVSLATDTSSAPDAATSRIGFANSARGGSAAQEAREKLSTAFHPSTPTREPGAFAGREDALATLIDALEVQKLHVVIYGDRGLGKTSLLHVMSHLAREGGYLVSYATCGSDSGFDSVFRQVAASVPLRHHAAADPATVAPADSLASLIGDAPLDVPRAAELLGGLRGARLLVLLDEFDRAQSEQFRLQVAELVKALSDTAARVQLAIAGVASNLNALIRHIPSIRRNIIGLPLGPMRNEELQSLLTLGSERSGLSFEPASEERLVSASNGSPYLANLLGQHAGLNATAANRTVITVADADRAAERSVDELGSRLTASTLQRIGALSEDELIDLVGAASIAMREVGRIGTDKLDRPERFGSLLVPLEGDDPGLLRFAEESAVPFLWLLGLTQRRSDAVTPIAFA